MCGIFGVWSKRPIVMKSLMCDGLQALQHRGEEGTGVMCTGGRELFHEVRLSPHDDSVRHFFAKVDMSELSFRMAIGHNRYATKGKISTLPSQHPIVRENKYGKVGVVHNGTLSDVEMHRKELMLMGQSFHTDCDTELFLNYLAISPHSDLPSAVINSLQKIRGSYSLLILNERELIAARDPRGFRPLSIATFNDGYLIASETCAFDSTAKEYGVKFLRDVEPGEVLFFSKEGGLTSVKPFGPASPKFCVFEWIYFSAPDSIVFNRCVAEFRMALGRAHAAEHSANIDCIVSVPDSANYFGDALAESLKLPNLRAIFRNHYAGRSFIKQDKLSRKNNVRRKLRMVKPLLEGKRPGIAEDSIVRSDTIIEINRMARECEVSHLANLISCPPLRDHCPFGIDIEGKEELVATGRTIEQIREYIGADELCYLSLESLQSIAGENFCYGCFTGEYPEV